MRVEKILAAEVIMVVATMEKVEMVEMSQNLNQGQSLSLSLILILD
jgi:hypothetical protein